MDADPPLIIFLLCALTALSMLFSAGESAYLSLNKLRLHVRLLKKDARAQKVSRLLERKDLLINTFLIGNALVNIGLTSLVTALAMSLWGSRGIGVAALASTVFLLIFGEITPKTLAMRHPEPVAYGFCHIIAFFTFLFSGPARFFASLAKRIAALFGIRLSESAVTFNEEEIKNFIEMGGEEGVIAAGGKDMMYRVFAFTDLASRDVMVPRVSMVTVGLDLTFDAVLALAERRQLWFFPVTGSSVDDLAGVLYVKDMLPFADDPTRFSVKRAMREPVYIPGTRKISSAQALLRENGQSGGIILDEYGGTAGLITTQDIAEVIFGKVGSHRNGIQGARGRVQGGGKER
jgi:CBS domain containing-hemolysin-like protein